METLPYPSVHHRCITALLLFCRNLRDASDLGHAPCRYFPSPPDVLLSGGFASVRFRSLRRAAVLEDLVLIDAILDLRLQAMLDLPHRVGAVQVGLQACGTTGLSVSGAGLSAASVEETGSDLCFFPILFDWSGEIMGKPIPSKDAIHFS